MSVLDDGVLTWNYQGYWTTNAGYGPAWLELLQNLNHRCDFLGVTRPTVPLMQPNPAVDPVTWVGLCSSGATPGYVFDMITAMQAALNTLETNAAWCDSDGTDYSGFDLTVLDGHNRTKLLAIVQHMIMSLDAHRYKLRDDSPVSVTTIGQWELFEVDPGDPEIFWSESDPDYLPECQPWAWEPDVFLLSLKDILHDVRDVKTGTPPTQKFYVHARRIVYTCAKTFDQDPPDHWELTLHDLPEPFVATYGSGVTDLVAHGHVARDISGSYDGPSLNITVTITVSVSATFTPTGDSYAAWYGAGIDAGAYVTATPVWL